MGEGQRRGKEERGKWRNRLGGGGGGLGRDSKLLGSSAKLVCTVNALRNLSCKQSQKFAAVTSRLSSE